MGLLMVLGWIFLALVRVCERHVCDVLCGLGDADGRRRHNSLSVRRLAARTAERIIVYYNLHRAEVFARAFFFHRHRPPLSAVRRLRSVKSQVSSPVLRSGGSTGCDPTRPARAPQVSTQLATRSTGSAHVAMRRNLFIFSENCRPRETYAYELRSKR